MRFETYIPTQSLRPYIKAYMVVEGGCGSVNRILPGTSATLAFRLYGQVSFLNGSDKTALAASTLSGLKKSVRLIDYAPQSAAIIVLFQQTGMTCFLRQPLHELFEQSEALDSFFPPSEIARVEQRIAESGNHLSKIATIEQFLLSKIVYTPPDKLVSLAIAHIHTLKGNLKMNALAKTLYISQDAFEKRFRKITGATPKQFSQIVKMNAIIHQKKANPSFGDLVFDNGYYDQPHFIKDFKVFTGQTPRDFFKAPRLW